MSKTPVTGLRPVAIAGIQIETSLEVTEHKSLTPNAPVRDKKRDSYKRLGGGRQRSFKLSKKHDQMIDQKAALAGVPKAEIVREKLSQSMSFDLLLEEAMRAAMRDYIEIQMLENPEYFQALMRDAMLATVK